MGHCLELSSLGEHANDLNSPLYGRAVTAQMQGGEKDEAVGRVCRVL